MRPRGCEGAMDLSDLLKKVTPEDVKTLRNLGVRFDPKTKSLIGGPEIEAVAQESIWRKCANDYEHFIIDSRLVTTLDNQQKWECGSCGHVVADFVGRPCRKCGGLLSLRDPVQPFPAHRYGPRYVIRILKTEPKLAIKKSRRLMATELMCAYALTLMMFRKGALCVFQSDKEDKANDNVRRVYGMWNRLPMWMKRRRPCNPTKGGDMIEGYFEIPGNYARLKAIPSGPEQIREMGPSFYFCDEAAFHQNAGATYAAVNQAIEAGCQAVYVSTAAAGFFAGLTNDVLEEVAA